MKITVGNEAGSYTFTAGTRTVTVTGLNQTVPQEDLLAIINTTTGQTLYRIADSSLLLQNYTPSPTGFTAQLNALLPAGGWTNNDRLAIILVLNSTLESIAPGYDPSTGRLLVGNLREKFRESFRTKDTTAWNYPAETNIRSRIDGNVAGESYLVISLSALVAGDSWELVSKSFYRPPYEMEWGMSTSYRLLGTDFTVETVGTAGATDSDVDVEATPADVVISGTLSVTSNVVTVTTATPHALLPGDSIVIFGCSDPRANIGPVVVSTITSPTAFTAPWTIANGTYTAGGSVRRVPLAGMALRQVGVRLVGATQGNTVAISRDGGGRARAVDWNVGNTQDAPIFPNEGGINYSGLNYVQAFRTKGTWHLEHTSKRVFWRARDIDATGTDRSTSLRKTTIPDPNGRYRIRVRARSFPNFTVPSAPITAAAKSGSTTWTITAPNHGLTAADFVVIYGIRDATNFPNLTTATQVASIVDANTFTIVSTTGTATSFGGFVMRVQGGNIPTIENRQIQTYNKTADGLRLVLVANTNWTTTIGDTFTVYGLVASTPTVLSSLNGRYRVAFVSTTTVELEPLESQNLGPVPTVATNCGGTLIRNIDLRLHHMRIYDRTRMEIDTTKAGSQGEPDPVTVVSMPSVTIGGGSLGAGTNLVGDFGVQYRASATGAALIHHVVAAASTNAAVIKASAGRVVGWDLGNTTAAWVYLKIHNQTTTPTAGTGVVKTIPIPPNGVNARSIEGGLGFATGIGRTTVTGAADADATAVTANAIVGDIYFQ